MRGSKREKRRWRKLVLKGLYWQGYMWPENKVLRNKLKHIEDLLSGGHYWKIGGWFEWN